MHEVSRVLLCIFLLLYTLNETTTSISTQWLIPVSLLDKVWISYCAIDSAGIVWTLTIIACWNPVNPPVSLLQSCNIFQMNCFGSYIYWMLFSLFCALHNASCLQFGCKKLLALCKSECYRKKINNVNVKYMVCLARIHLDVIPVRVKFPVCHQLFSLYNFMKHF